MLGTARRVHELKCWPEFFQAAIDGTKTFEVRINDRGFSLGDVLRLQEFYVPGRTEGKSGYSGREALFEVTYLLNLHGLDIFRQLFNSTGLEYPLVVMAIKPFAGE